MPMDCCHILLGKPQKHDTYVVHDGRLNQYTLWVNERKKVLFPLIESIDEVNCITIQVCVINGKKFIKEMKNNQIQFFIVPKRLCCASSD